MSTPAASASSASTAAVPSAPLATKSTAAASQIALAPVAKATAIGPPAAAQRPKPLTQAELEKQRKAEALARKKALDARFKNRSKRKSDAVEGEGAESGAGRKKQKELSAYEKEVAEINKRVGLSDTGAGVRPVTK